ncbi:MAG: DUF1566 domain-containing protein [Leptospiraceae bacterium]|nr:DUF1566 domain-containing protein [Leptospiraceae bacterium]MCP5501121.1 DUF1566 domain-containing protein [Leptospiraceae bacterium]
MKRLYIINLIFVFIMLSTALKAAPFTDNGNGTVTDTATGLIWQQGEGGQATWANALSYCNTLSLVGRAWRLPNRNELQSIVDYTKASLTIDTTAFPSAVASNYWSSTTGASYTTSAWNVHFSGGNVSGGDKSFSYYVRCVSGP